MAPRMDPKKQFSKWLARYGAVVWGVYLLIIAALMYFRPETAMPCVYLVLILTVNKMIDTVAYTRNSTTEKLILGMLDKTKMQLSLKGVATSIATSGKSNIAKEDENDQDDDEMTILKTAMLRKGRATDE